MTALVNALSGANRSSSVLGNIASPMIANPLGAFETATKAATGIYGVRELQAQQALGGIMQQATDPQTGAVDWGKAQSLAAAAGPTVQMGMSDFLRNAQVTRGQQFTLNDAQLGAANDAVSTALSFQDPDQMKSAVLNGVDRLVKTGVIPQSMANQVLMHLNGQDPALLRSQLQQLQIQTMPPAERQGQLYGTGQTYVTPQGTYTTVVPPTRQGPQVTVPHGPTPGQTTQVSVPYDDQGVIPQDANGVPTRTPKGWRPVTVPITAVPGVPTGGPPSISRQPTPGGTTPPLPSGYYPRGNTLQPQPQGATGATGAPQGPTGATTPPPTPTGATAAPGGPQGPQPPAVTQRPPAFTTAPQGQPEQIEQDQKLYGTDIAQMQDNIRRNVAGKAALDALELARTGPGTSFVAQKLAFLQAQGIPLPFGSDPNAYSSAANYQVLQKNLLRFAQNSSITSGTNLGLETTLHSTANAEQMLPAANRHVVLQDMGLLRQKMAMVLGQDPSGTDYRDRTNKFPTQTDPTAFIWDQMKPEERQAYLQQIDPNGAHTSTAYKKWHQSMMEARNTGVWATQPGG